ncbi:hypothetical protein LguiA_006197 [Lonicera macranthoides]
MELCSVFGQFPSYSLRHRSGVVPTICSFLRTQKSLVFCSSLPRTNSAFQVKPESSRNQMFILGMGFVGNFFAQDLKNREGWNVSGTCTSITKKKKLEEMGFLVHVFDAIEPEPEVLNTMNNHTHLVVSIPPVVGIGDLMLQHGELLKSRLADGNLQWLCYLSSTGVYGNCDGAWVDEDYAVMPSNESAKARLAAEEGWLNLGHDLGLSAQVFRLGGIYGPGRSAVNTLVKEEPLSKVQRMRSSKQYTSRIHVADICQALNACIRKPSTGKIYNIVDDDPAPRAEVFEYARNLVEKKWPPRQVKQAEKAETFIPMVNLGGEKRVSNTRMKKELGVSLIHPSYRSGLQSIIDHMDG